MDRIKVPIPDQWIFKTEVQIRVGDLNYGNHVGNDRYLLLAQEARCRWLSAMGFRSEVDIDPPIGLIVSEASVEYKAEAFQGDHLIIEVGNLNITRFGFNQIYRFRRQEKDICLINMGILFFNFKQRKLSNPAQSIRQKLLDPALNHH